eukprot:5471807-Amphidinium_carterae.1
MDPLKLGKPPMFTGDKAAYEDWAFKLKAFMGKNPTQLVVLTDKTALGIVKQVGNQDGFEAYRRLAIRYAPRTLGRNLTRLTSIIDHDF